LPISAFALLLAPGSSYGLALAAVMMIGFSLGSEIDIIAYLTSRIFTLDWFGTLFGLLTSIIALGGAIGPQGASAIFDATGAYDLLLLISIPVLALGALAIATLPGDGLERREASGRNIAKEGLEA
jgi:MFS family permease